MPPGTLSSTGHRTDPTTQISIHPEHSKTRLQEGQYESSVPVIADRALQAHTVNALEPEWEARFEPKSYGFRPGRGCHDAIVAIHGIASGKLAKRLWALDADLQSAFDRLSHDHILASLGGFPARDLVRRWLKAGVVEDGALSATEEGAPQGGVSTPPTQ